MGVEGFDEGDFFASAPLFDLLFPGDSGPDIGGFFVVGEGGYVVSPGEAFVDAIFVFVHSSIEVIGVADVEVFSFVGEDVDEVLMDAAWGHGGGSVDGMGLW